MESDIFWSEIGSGLGEQGGTPHDHQEFNEYPPGMPPVLIDLKIIVDRIISIFFPFLNKFKLNSTEVKESGKTKPIDWQVRTLFET